MVTRQEQLKWLAHKYKTWPEQGATYLGLSVAEVGKFAIVNCHLITRQEWQQERDKMQKKQEEKLMSENEFEDELEKMYWDFDAERAKKGMCERLNFKMFMRIARGLRVERKQENSWHERGELPPVGVPVELWVGGSFAYNCELITRRGHNYVMWNLDADRPDAADYMNSQFRPLRTERKKAIDEMLLAIDHIKEGSFETFIGALYDAGYRKVNNK